MSPRSIFFFLVGILFLALAKAKNMLHGYSTPKPMDISDTDRCVAYDMGVLDLWLTHLEAYGFDRGEIRGRNILELGPGSDLGIGMCLLALGCKQYTACDVNDLMSRTPHGFYDAMIRAIESRMGSRQAEGLKEALAESGAGVASRLRYIVQKEYDLTAAVGERSTDLVFSQAAFEHFEDAEGTIRQLSRVSKAGAVLVINIDLQTHSRWIREKDPNNIYRYPPWLYRLFRFRGIPNRMRPDAYKRCFERAGWTGISITPIVEVAADARPYDGVHRDFAAPESRMEWLSVMLCATRAED